MTRLEGDAYVRLIQMFGPSKRIPDHITLGTIKSLPPEVSVLVEGDSVVTPHEGVIVAEDLLDHKRIVSYTAGTVSGDVDGFHGPGNLRSLDIVDGELTIKSPLKLEDRVIVAISNDGQLVYVLAKAGD
ncbi:DUF2577 family protein [Lysinibacillus sp.]|uniref:DUF2577 family protein n=1 Tax=Lysinibacillus sp. TaxID=1869345 RepID=UPI0028978659|nr:DUF2577 family protein [Lysinibacillus sp.]